MSFIKRTLTVLLITLIWLDEGVQVFWRGIWYIATGQGEPSPHETISAWLGMSAAKGKPVGTYLVSLVDDIFGHGHCARAAEYEATVDSAL